ncbi:MAG: hypothetical protein M3167_00375 [Acidobacteriota bacterium]|nr:hypothetical protein [Acidobacteriota bacterium]
MSTWKDVLDFALLLRERAQVPGGPLQPRNLPISTVVCAPSDDEAGGSLDPRRLRHEQEQLRTAFAGTITLAQFPGTNPSAWSSRGVVVSFAPFTITGRYEPEHPYKPPRFQIAPQPRSRHYYADRRGPHLCYTRPEQWQPHFTIATALGTVIRFLTEYQKGATE